MELGVRRFRLHELFHGISWHSECANFDDKSSSMEFGVRHVGHKSSSMEFCGITWDLECANFDDTSRHMEFHGTFLVIKYKKVEIAWILVELKHV